MGDWIGWLEHETHPLRFEELWGARLFVGTYPVPGRTGVFVGGLRTDMAVRAPAFVAGIHQRLANVPAPLAEALGVVASGAGYLWRMEDRRASRWCVGRVALLGDAAVGFLPTAGVGAAIAIESAGVLATTLADCRSSDIAERLELFEGTQRPRSEAAKKNSRQLAALMFQRNPTVAALRDLGSRLLPARWAMGPIRQLLEQRLDIALRWLLLSAHLTGVWR